MNAALSIENSICSVASVLNRDVSLCDQVGSIDPSGGNIDAAGGLFLFAQSDASGWLSQLLQAITSYDRAYFASENLGGLALLILVVACLFFWWSYRRANASLWEIVVGVGLKAGAILALLFCLLEPMNVAEKAEPGENVLGILADSSMSLKLTDADSSKTRGERLNEALSDKSGWQKNMEETFDLRRFQFDERVRAVTDYDLEFSGNRTAIADAVLDVADRLTHRPLAGILLLTDGNSEDLDALIAQSDRLPPIYTVPVGEGQPERDLRIKRLSVSQTNFVASPVTVMTEFDAVGASGEKVVLSLIDPAGEIVESQSATIGADSQSQLARFQFQPQKVGVLTYRVVLQTEKDFEDSPGELADQSQEATLENNLRYAIVDRGGGPYRVLYVSGRPNWEFKYIRRAVFDDPEVQLVGLLRIANREPKFSFRSRAGESTNPLFRGFDRTDEETEQYDQPVLMRINTDDGSQLRDGFPKAPEELFEFDAVVLDDIDSDYFTPEQLLLLRRFVSERGGGLIMLGGLESFSEGKFANTPVEDLLPIYLDRSNLATSADGYRWNLARDGWLQPWARLRRTEVAERKRLTEMPVFRILNRTSRIKPGAELLATVNIDGESDSSPALVTHTFGKGRVAATMIGDLWRWDLHRPEPVESDLQAHWRQSIRWLCADVPKRVQVETRRGEGQAADRVQMLIKIFDPVFAPMDNASVKVSLLDPTGEEFEMTAEPSDTVAGEYLVDIASRISGSYVATVTAASPDGTVIDTRQAGWTAEPDFAEFKELGVNREQLRELSEKTGGELVELRDLKKLANSLPDKKVPRMETIRYPLWHQGTLFLIAIGCLVCEWGWRRLRGLP